MSALQDLLKRFEQEQASKLSAEEARARDEARQEQEHREQIFADLRAKGREYLGEALFDELAGETQYVTPYLDQARLVLVLGPGPEFLWLARAERVQRPAEIVYTLNIWQTVGGNEELELPAKPLRVAEMVSRAVKQRSTSRQRAIQEALEKIQGTYDFYPLYSTGETPQQVFDHLANLWPDAADEVRPVLEERLKALEVERAKEAAAVAEAEAEARRVWKPFPLYAVVHATRVLPNADPELDGAAEVVTETAWSTEPRENVLGVWPVLRRGEIVPTHIPSVLRVEEHYCYMPIDVPSGVCRVATRAGVAIVYPPGAEYADKNH